jgi:septal ring factor EnvC (AmiA/AmiB activator)
LLGLLFCFFISFSQTTSRSKKDLESKKRRIGEEINEINSLLKETKTSKKNSIGALLNLNMKIEKREELIRTIMAEIGVINTDISVTEKRSETLKNNLIKLKSDYAKMIIFAQRNQDSYSKLMFVFAANDFNQAYARLKYFQQYSDFRKKQAGEIVKTQTQLIANLNELKDQRHEKNMLLGNEEAEKDSLSVEKVEQEGVLTSLQEKEKDLKKELEKKKQETIELQMAIKKLIAEEMRRQAEEMQKQKEEAAIAAKKAREEKAKKNKKTEKNPKENPEVNNVAKVKENKMPNLDAEDVALSVDFAENRGKLPWPVGKGVICEAYGEHEHPAIKGFMIVNNGLEICASQGTQARAVFEGEVRSIALSPTGGKLVIIKHGEYMSVYCNLMDVEVRTGQKVSAKQVIGTVMHNDDEGKTSMNFQIWKGTKTMDPGGWLYNPH